MKKSSHNKIKNTSVIFELLVRKVTSDILNGTKHSSAIPIIKEHFRRSSILGKELNLYQSLSKPQRLSESKANYLIDEVVKMHRTLDKKTLNRAKYEVIKEIKNAYDFKKFFEVKIANYRRLGSIYVLFETGGTTNNPETTVKNRYALVEAMTIEAKKKDRTDDVESVLKEQDKDIRILTYRLMVDKFNKKHSSMLDENQRRLIKNYICNVDQNNPLRDFIETEITTVKRQIKESMSKVDDEVVKIKLNEIVKMLDEYKTSKVITESDILNLLRYYELAKELKELK